MTSSIKLTDTQRQVLLHAVDHNSGRVLWFPQSVKGGARQKVIDGLSHRALIIGIDTDWRVSAEGYKALGRSRPTPAGEQASESTRRPRERSKQAVVIQMLRRPEGTSIPQICAITGWQAHTVRGAFAGTIKRKLGLNLVSAKGDDGERVYRIV